MLDWSGSPPLEQVYGISLLLFSPSMRPFVRASLSVSPSLCLSVSLSRARERSHVLLVSALVRLHVSIHVYTNLLPV